MQQTNQHDKCNNYHLSERTHVPRYPCWYGNARWFQLILKILQFCPIMHLFMSWPGPFSGIGPNFISWSSRGWYSSAFINNRTVGHSVFIFRKCFFPLGWSHVASFHGRIKQLDWAIRFAGKNYLQRLRYLNKTAKSQQKRPSQIQYFCWQSSNPIV